MYKLPVYYRAGKAVPELMHLLKESPDDYIAGISAQTIAVCGDRSTFDTIVDQFLRRKAEPSMIFAVEETGTSDERLFQKRDKLVSGLNPEYEEVPQVPRKVDCISFVLEYMLHESASWSSAPARNQAARTAVVVYHIGP
jgi:hypothetical protein